MNDLLRQPGWVEGFSLKDRWATRYAYCFRLAENWREETRVSGNG